MKTVRALKRKDMRKFEACHLLFMACPHDKYTKVYSDKEARHLYEHLTYSFLCPDVNLYFSILVQAIEDLGAHEWLDGRVQSVDSTEWFMFGHYESVIDLLDISKDAFWLIIKQTGLIDYFKPKEVK